TSDWYNVGGGDGFQGRVDPEEPEIVYAQSQEGNVTRLDLRTGISTNIRPRTTNTSGMAQEDIEAEIRTNTLGRGGEEAPAATPPATPPEGAPAGATPPGGAQQGRGAGRGGPGAGGG